MIAYHNDPTIKKNILKQLRAHAKADEIVKGRYWEDGKGCAVGCTIHSNDHHAYEARFGIPEVLARVEDAIFEGLPNDRARGWPVAFMSAIVPGTDLSRVHWAFLHWLLTTEAVNPGINHPLVRDTVKQCADLLEDFSRGGKKTPSAASNAAWSVKESAAASAEASAAAKAAWDAASNAATEAGWRMSVSAKRSAESAARSAWSAVRSAVRSAAESAAASAAWRGERDEESAESAAAYVLMSNKLLTLLKETK